MGERLFFPGKLRESLGDLLSRSGEPWRKLGALPSLAGRIPGTSGAGPELAGVSPEPWASSEVPQNGVVAVRRITHC
jgi:hypothetical protein